MRLEEKDENWFIDPPDPRDLIEYKYFRGLRHFRAQV